MRNPLHAAADLAVWPGLYVASAVVCIAQIAGLDTGVARDAKLRAAGFAFCTTMAVYLLDRVKLTDAWLDPSDAEAYPARYAFLTRNSGRVRGLILLLLAGAVWLGAHLLSWGAVMPPLAAIGVLVYAGRPRSIRPRPKDLVVLKNIYVAAGITGFATITAVAALEPMANPQTLCEFAVSHGVVLSLSCAHLFSRVFADATLSDLDDEEADRRYGTGTLPTYLGRTRAWTIAFGVRLGLALLLVLVVVFPAPARIAWATVTIVSTFSLRFIAPRQVRDWVDVRFPMEAAMVAVALVLWRMHSR